MQAFSKGKRVLILQPEAPLALMNPMNPNRLGTVVNQPAQHRNGFVRVQWDGTKPTSAGYYHPKLLQIANFN
jgi:hypothetical protein